MLDELCGITVQFLPYWFHTSSAHSLTKSFIAVTESLATTMGKARRQVSAALHTELSEYSSLIRALRTGDTLDLASQLTRPQPSASTYQQNAPESDKDPTPSDVSTSRDVSPNIKGKGRSKDSRSTGKAKAKDNWTRWPLLARDIRAPEFEFRDEVKAIASHILQSQLLKNSNGTDILPADKDEDTIFPPLLLDSLTLASATHLSQILSALAAHIPLMEKSMQNRIKPIGWESVLDIVAATGLVDPKSV